MTNLLNPLPEERRLLVLTPTGRDGPMTIELLRANGVHAFLCDDLAVARERNRGGRRRRARGRRSAGRRSLRRAGPRPGAAAGVVGSAGRRADQSGRRFGIGRACRPDARQRHAARAAGAGRGAGQRDPDGDPRAGPAVSDSRAFAASRTSGGIAERSRPPQRRVSGDARARAAQSAGADQQRHPGAPARCRPPIRWPPGCAR